jgi:flagellar motor protein MotB
MDTKEMTRQAQTLETQIKALQVTNTEELKYAGDVLANVKLFIKGWTAKKKELIKPFKDGIEGIENEFDPQIDKAKEHKEMIENKIVPFQMSELKRQQDEAQKLKEAELVRLENEKEKLEDKALNLNSDKVLNEALKVEERQGRLMSTPTKQSFSVDSGQSKTGITMLWTYEVTDEKLVPREYCVSSKGLLNKAVDDGIREIAGVKIYQKPSITSR